MQMQKEWPADVQAVLKRLKPKPEVFRLLVAEVEDTVQLARMLGLLELAETEALRECELHRRLQ